jgi:excisionase family DNA binding protein
MTPISAGPARELVESLRKQLGSDAVVLITPGPRSCAVVIASAPGYPARLTNNQEPTRDEDRREPHSAGDERPAYSVAEAAGALGLSRDMIYQQLRAGRLGSLKVGGRRIIPRHHIDVFLAGGT